MITRIGEAEMIGGGGSAPTWRVHLSEAPPPEWRRSFLEVALGDDTIFSEGLHVHGAAVVFNLSPGDLRVGLERLDAAIAAATSGGGPVAQPDRSSTGAILVVDDQPDVCVVTTDILQAHGYRATSTADARRAVRMAIDDPPQLVITDVVMPLMSGRELAERILAARPDTKVLFMSAYTVQNQIPARAALLRKPFTVDELLSAVKAALSPPPSPFRKRPS